MKNILKQLMWMISAALLFASCDKKDVLTSYKTGNTPILSSSVTTVAAAAADSNKTVLNFSWTNPGFATDSASVKYIIQIDSAGKNFANGYSLTVSGALDTSFIAKQFNSILLGFGFGFGISYSVDVRLIASYANNNDQKISNTVTIKATPYKVPPKVPLPSSGELFLVGNATQGGWNNPVPVPSQQFTQVDETTWIGVFNLIGGNEYLMLPVNGDWTHKYAVADKTVAGLNTGGDFGLDAKDNFPAPAASGWYKITVDFQHGTFKVESYTGTVPDSLYIVGSATNGGWNNPVPTPSQQFTKLSSTQFELTVSLLGGQQFLLLPVNGDWSHKYAATDNVDATGGMFQEDAGANFPGPGNNGTYKVDVDFAANTYTVKSQ